MKRALRIVLCLACAGTTSGVRAQAETRNRNVTPRPSQPTEKETEPSRPSSTKTPSDVAPRPSQPTEKETEPSRPSSTKTPSDPEWFLGVFYRHIFIPNFLLGIFYDQSTKTNE